MPDPTQRFSSRVQNYIKYRPGYPTEVYDYLRSTADLIPGVVIADIGSGTGLSSQLFLQRGHRVIGVEPNTEMRAAAENLLAGDGNFTSLAGRAEDLPLPDGSVDFIVAGQAFHWFEPVAARAEMMRVLRPGGQVVLIWNMRDTQGSEFQQAYEQMLLDFGTDFKQVDHQRNFPDERIAAFFAPFRMKKALFSYAQEFDFEGLRGRLLSSSYAPTEENPAYAPMLAALQKLFADFQMLGNVTFLYKTHVYHGSIGV